MLKQILAAGFAATCLIAAPASAQVSVGLGTKVDLGTKVRVGAPYTYRGYRSGRWYYDDYQRRNRYYSAYGGYDCHRGFQYTWEGDNRTRYESYWCFDDGGRYYEVRSTRTSVRVR